MVKIKEEHRKKASKKKEETITLSKVTLWKGISGMLGVLLLISLISLFFTGGFGGEKSSGAAAPAAVAPKPSIQIAAGDMEALADDDPFLGDENAPVTMVEFSDYECPFCARFYSQTLNQIKSRYVDTGKVKFVYRDFPLSFHPQAEPAAIAANCAGMQGKYFEFHDKIFDNGGAAGKGRADYKRWAQELSLDIATWESCLNDPQQKLEIQKDMRDGAAVGIRGTPGFIINGQLISGAQPFSVFEQIIEAQLN